MTKTDVVKILTYLYADVGKQPSKTQVTIWHDQLQTVDFGKGMAAARVLLREKTYGAPQFSDYFRILSEMMKTAEDHVGAGEAWELVIQAARRFGITHKKKSYAFLKPYPRICKAVKQTGWNRICLSDEKQLPFVCRDFKEYYEAIQQKVARGEQVKLDYFGSKAAKGLLEKVQEKVALPDSPDAEEK